MMAVIVIDVDGIGRWDASDSCQPFLNNDLQFVRLKLICRKLYSVISAHSSCVLPFPHLRRARTDGDVKSI